MYSMYSNKYQTTKASVCPNNYWVFLKKWLVDYYKWLINWMMVPGYPITGGWETTMAWPLKSSSFAWINRWRPGPHPWRAPGPKRGGDAGVGSAPTGPMRSKPGGKWCHPWPGTTTTTEPPGSVVGNDYMVVSWNRGTPNHPMLILFSNKAMWWF